MDGFEVVLAAVLVAVAVLNAVASRLGVPYPIVLVVGGLGLGLLPGLPDVELEPDLVLLVFLPPLLYTAAFFADLRALRRYARALSLISVGLVLLTTALVAIAGHAVLGRRRDPRPGPAVLRAARAPLRRPGGDDPRRRLRGRLAGPGPGAAAGVGGRAAGDRRAAQRRRHQQRRHARPGA